MVRGRVGVRPERQLGSDVQHVDEQPRALDVGEEVVPQPRAFACALDQPGDVGDDELALGRIEHAEHRRERRERVVGDLRRGPRQPRQKRGLAGVREPDQPDVGEQLQPQLDPPGLPRQPPLGEPGRLPGRRREALVPLAAFAAARGQGPLPVGKELPAAPGELSPLLARGRLHLGAGRHANLERLAVGAVALRALPVAAAAGAEAAAAPERLQVAQGAVADEQHVAAAPAVAAVRPAAGHVCLAAEARRAVPAGAGLDLDPRPVVQHRPILPDRARRAPGGGSERDKGRAELRSRARSER